MPDARRKERQLVTTRLEKGSGSRTLARGLILLAYAAVFWAVLPWVMLRVALHLDAALGLAFTTSRTARVIAWPALALCLLLFAVAIAQYRARVGQWPVSAFRTKKLAQGGLYRLWRHPIYLFYVLAVALCGLLLGSGAGLLIVLPLLCAGTVTYAAIEERALAKLFGPCAEGYRRRTGVIIPRLQMRMRVPLLLLFGCLLRLRVNHRERIPAEGPFFVVASHRSYLDPFFVAVAIPRFISFVTTDRAFSGRFVSWLLRRMGCIRRKRHRSDVRCARKIIRDIDECGVVGLFPEGERSWTGGVGELKPEVMRLLLRFPEVPVLPVRIQGSYRVWPRWRDRPWPGRLTVTVEEPLMPSEEESPEALAERLGRLIRPREDHPPGARAPACSGLERVLYRCPSCLSFRSLLRSDGGLACSSCGAYMVLDRGFALHVRSSAREEVLAIHDAWERVRARPGDLQTGAFAAGAMEAPLPPLPPGERVILATPRSRVSYSTEEGPMSGSGEIAVMLTGARLITPGAAREALPLAGITSVTTEGSSLLRVYHKPSRTLLQLQPGGDSVLLWQDLLVLAIEAISGRAPVRS